MYKEHPEFIIPSDGTTIWRYIDFIKFFSLINGSILYFPSALQLAKSDPYEGSFTRGDIEYDPSNDSLLLNLGLEQGALDILKVNEQQARLMSKEHLRKAIYINSWYINDFESAAMWKVYAENNKGIAIKSSVWRLKEAVQEAEEDVFIGKVTYLDYESETMLSGNMFKSFLHKRKSFEYENELRAISQNISALTPPMGFNIKVNLDTLIESIYVAPDTADWIQDLIRSILAQKALFIPIVKSGMQDGGLW